MGIWGSEVDVTDLIVRGLPTHLRTILQEIETAFGSRVRFIRVDRLPRSGGAMAHVDDEQPVVRLTIGVDTDESVLAEELLHLKRRANGHPAAKATYSGELREYGIICDGLTGLLDEYSFFSQLESWGYNPFSEVEQILQKYTGKFANGFIGTLPRVRQLADESTLEHHWGCKLALEYARMDLLAEHSGTREEFLHFYNRHPDLQAPRDRGRQVAELIRGNSDQSPSGTLRLLETILRSILELPEGTYEIRTY